MTFEAPVKAITQTHTREASHKQTPVGCDKSTRLLRTLQTHTLPACTLPGRLRTGALRGWAPWLSSTLRARRPFQHSRSIASSSGMAQPRPLSRPLCRRSRAATTAYSRAASASRASSTRARKPLGSSAVRGRRSSSGQPAHGQARVVHTFVCMCVYLCVCVCVCPWQA